ncbi:MAG TPA: hypothetical protein VGX23_33600 [Actinocrinis sp.]|nr:hypothetical protein [Actinocrinis sp.]
MSAPTIEPASLFSLDPAGDLAPGHARRWLRAELVVRAMPAGLVEDVVLVVSELVTNSAKYVGGRVVVGLKSSARASCE